MKKWSWLILIAALAAALATACGDDDDDGSGGDADTDTDTDTDTDADTDGGFEAAGEWVYSGGEEFSATLVLTDDSMSEESLEGESWTSEWTITEYDNDADHYHAVLDSSTGEYSFEEGDEIYVSYVLDGDTLQVYFGETDYPAGEGGTEGVDYWEYTAQ